MAKKKEEEVEVKEVKPSGLKTRFGLEKKPVGKE